MPTSTSTGSGSKISQRIVDRSLCQLTCPDRFSLSGRKWSFRGLSVGCLWETIKMALAISLGSYFDTLAAFLRSIFSANGPLSFWGSWVTVVVRSINTMPFGEPVGFSPPRAGVAAVAVDSEGPCCTSCAGGVTDPILEAVPSMLSGGAAANEGKAEAPSSGESLSGRGCARGGSWKVSSGGLL